ncbi:MAG: phosphatidylserine decarboxylase [Sulfurimonas sp.]|uniref:phosphatidylserine decarboxylase n=1 Tax=Sulfurimonas sp. TaxID=2022749 RepID=UPI00260A7FBF|nr:phosphatidylserine decarboxylase [Sulfurimonas sp.]MDD5399841.1 phosphatidylserine decarboxylase [Sulfurimonas sp.]
MRNNLLPIAKEGWSYIVGALLLMLVFMLLHLAFLQFFAFLATLFFVFVFRNPERQNMLYQENSVVSPVDGTVISIEELDNDDSYAYKVDIDNSYLDVSLLRVPFTSVLEHVELHRGTRLSNMSSLSKVLNENAKLVFSDKNSNNKVKITHTLKQSFKSIDLDVANLQNLQQGSRYGLMINGVTTLYLPHNFRLNISLGAELIASESLLGYFTSEK